MLDPQWVAESMESAELNYQSVMQDWMRRVPGSDERRQLALARLSRARTYVRALRTAQQPTVAT